MSSPHAKKEKTAFDRWLIKAHRSTSHSTRISILASLLAQQIEATIDAPAKLRCLDIGCGDLTLAKLLETVHGIGKWTGVDLYPLPSSAISTDARWRDYVQFNGQELPFPDQGFDVGIFVDVLHHVPEESRVQLLRESLRTCKLVIVKDHFESSFWSRQVLRAMDFVGNYAYGVSVPKRYFTKESFARLCDEAGAGQTGMRVGVRLYDHLPIVRNLLQSDWHFVCQLIATKSLKE
jgi:SAM-dependent methyltransferase